MPDQNNQDLNECPKCKALSATTEVLSDGASRFFCTKNSCDFEIVQHKKSFDKSLKALRQAKNNLSR